jgi:hypothetical protein
LQFAFDLLFLKFPVLYRLVKETMFSYFALVW